ncbi:uncharacterized protein LOC125675116 [Ostrea edulis]|uniref:uncharacterized protein LOC125675116 n=1 Tax=Ostrea edulis TaxID=37623 RepID=UPI0020964BF3|nr:uncharacterized protein LOC125675116 [Ostrea edulis]
MQMYILIISGVLLISYYLTAASEDSCFSSIPTLSVVSVCPKNRKEWIAASDRKQCSRILQNCTRPGNFQYHCLVNTNADGLVEVCLPVRRIVGQYCSFYDDKKIRAENHYHLPCGEHDVICPEFYQSNEAYKYQGCYKTVTTGDTSTEESPSGQMDDNQIEVQLDTFWSLIAIIVGVSIIAILGTINVVVQLIRTETKQSCYRLCGPNCCDCCSTHQEESSGRCKGSDDQGESIKLSSIDNQED